MKKAGVILLKERSQLAVHITANCHICKAIWRMSGGIQDAIILSYTTWNSILPS